MIHFCMELSKQLGIFYKTPPMPVDLTIQNESHRPFLGYGANMPISAHGEFAGPPRPATTGEGSTLADPPQPQPNLEAFQSHFPARLSK